MYKIPSLQKSDEGEYFSIFYDSSDTCAYVSKQIVALNVQDESQQAPDATPGDDIMPSLEPTAGPGSASGEDDIPSAQPTAGPGSAPNGDGTSSVQPPATSVSASGSDAGGQSGIIDGGNTGDDIGTGTRGNAKAEDDKKSIIPKVAKVKKFKVKVRKKGLALTWKKNAKASGYQIQISTKKSFKGAKKISLQKNRTSYQITRLKSGKRYYVRIRAYQSYKTQEGKKKKAYGKWTTGNH